MRRFITFDIFAVASSLRGAAEESAEFGEPHRAVLLDFASYLEAGCPLGTDVSDAARWIGQAGGCSDRAAVCAVLSGFLNAMAFEFAPGAVAQGARCH